MEAGVSCESLVNFENCVRRHIYEVSDTVCQFPDKVITKKVYSRTLKYSHNKNNGLRIIRIYIFALLHLCQLIFVSISVS
jgi:hypothetical protein